MGSKKVFSGLRKVSAAALVERMANREGRPVLRDAELRVPGSRRFTAAEKACGAGKCG